jgi:hypothetical protein
MPGGDGERRRHREAQRQQGRAEIRGAHINHLHFQVGPASYTVTRSQ